MGKTDILHDPLVRRVEATLRQSDLVPRGKAIGVAVSGGPDSVALLKALVALGPRQGWRLVVLHVNHTLRGRESGADQRFVRALARRHRFPFRTQKIDYGGTGATPPHDVSEERLRTLRYSLLCRMAKESGTGAVALGHHRDDLAETVLMHLLRGSGPAGMGGFKAKSRMGGVDFIRPLYDCTREEILAFCERRGLRWREDRTNRDTRWLRNRVRHELLPMLEASCNPRLGDLLADNARWFQEDEDYFEAKACEALGLEGRKRRAPRSLPLEALRALAPPVLARLFRIWVKAATGHDVPPSGRQVADLIELTRRRPGRGEVPCSPSAVFCVQGDRLTLWQPDRPGERFPRPDEEPPPGRGDATQPLVFSLPPGGETLPSEGRHEVLAPDGETALHIELMRRSRSRLPEGLESTSFPSNGESLAAGLTQYFDADRIEEPLVVRHRRPGDRFHPLGARGGKKLKDFLIDQKVPVALRRCVVLLGDQRRILWVVGKRICHPARLTGATQTVLCVRMSVAIFRP
jgi:tRNA(Ile)-lysidine synthase